MHQRDISEVNAILNIDETDHVTGQKLFEGQDPEALYNMSTDIFIVDTPWLIENWSKKFIRTSRKLRYILRDLAVEYGHSLLNTLAILPIFTLLSHITALILTCWKLRNSCHSSHQIKKFIPR